MTRRLAVAGVAVAALELVLWQRYAALDVTLHYWLHLLHGTAAGIALWVAVAAARWRPADPAARRLGLLTAAVAGHLFTAIPDVLFLVGGLLHRRWMDVFAVHIRIHMVPGALWVALGLLGLSLTAWLGLSAGHRRAACVGVAAVAVATTVAVAVAPPIPSTLAEVEALAAGGLWCPLVPTGGG